MKARGLGATLIPTPGNPTDNSMQQLRADLAKLAGRTALVEAQTGQWGNQRTGSGGGWKPERIGANPPAALVQTWL